MTKSKYSLLVTLLLAAPLPALADSANVSMYGVADVSYDLIDTGTSTSGTQGTTIDKASSNSSRIGFKGSEDLGDGLSASWQIESLVQLDSSSNSCAAGAACTANNGIFATRNSFGSLGSKDYGTLLIGRYDTPYKISTRKLDSFADSIADNRSLFGTISSTSASTSFVTKQPDVVAYTSPMLDGFTASIAHVNLAETATAAAAAKANATSLALMYQSESLYGAVGYETHKLDSVRGGGSEAAWVASLGYTLDELSLAAAYESTSDTLGGATSPTACAKLAAGADCLGHSAAYVTAKYNIGSGIVKLAYTKAAALAYAANTGATHAAIGYDYRLSKRTTLYALYTRLANETAANYNLASSAYSSATTTSIGAGSTLTAWSLGFRQTF